MDSKVQLFKNWLEASAHIVFFGGAGVSTESGIPDFRSTEGLYNTKYKYPPETILSHSFFIKHTKEFYEFYREKMVFHDAEPNITHIKLKELEDRGKLSAIITQNIDGLHQKAGCSNVLELHGSIYRNYCMDCNQQYSLEDILLQKDIPYCRCGGVIKPDVVLYEEPLNEAVIRDAIRYVRNADMIIVGGTSLSVYPAAGLIDYYHKNRLVLINKSETTFDSRADLLMNASLGEIFSEIYK